jgi:hypothetical protein
VRGSTRSGASGKRRWDEVASLLSEAAELGVEFDELQQLGVFEANCNAWRMKAESAVSACSWLNITCSSWNDADDAEDNGGSENDVEESGDDGNACAVTLCTNSTTGDDDVEGPPVVDVKEIFKSSWWITDDIQARLPPTHKTVNILHFLTQLSLSSLAAVEAEGTALNIEIPRQREVAQASYAPHS